MTATEVIKKLMSLGVMATVNEVIDYDTAEIVATELGAKVEKEEFNNRAGGDFPGYMILPSV